MPELPEVETIARLIAPRLAGRKILAAEFRCGFVMRADPDRTAGMLIGRKIARVHRRGKFIVLELEGGGFVSIHLGMTGRLFTNGDPGPYTRAILTLDRGMLLFDDTRRLGRFEVTPELPARIARLGPEPLEVEFAEFAARLAKRKARVKAVLLNQMFLRGIGNIYADEALFRAGIHPLAIASRLRKDRVRRLHKAVVQVLTEAIAKGGSSVSSYVDADGRRGFFQVEHRVYRRTGEPCVTCGTPIRRVLVTQRGTHFCPRCQKR